MITRAGIAAVLDALMWPGVAVLVVTLVVRSDIAALLDALMWAGGAVLVVTLVVTLVSLVGSWPR